jgi:hypothetical protein
MLKLSERLSLESKRFCDSKTNNTKTKQLLGAKWDKWTIAFINSDIPLSSRKPNHYVPLFPIQSPHPILYRSQNPINQNETASTIVLSSDDD